MKIARGRELLTSDQRLAQMQIPEGQVLCEPSILYITAI